MSWAALSVSGVCRTSSMCWASGSKLRCIRSTPIETASTRLKFFECLARTGVKSPWNAMLCTHQDAKADAHGEAHALIVGVTDADREPDAGDAEFQVEHPEHPHAIVRDGVLVAHHFDAPEAEGFEQRFDDLIVRKRLVG